MVTHIDLEVVNIQDPGHEEFYRKYVYWIPVLHCEENLVSKGKCTENDIREALKQWDQQHQPKEGET